MNENILNTTGQANDLADKGMFLYFTDALHRFFYFRVHDNEIADDLAQETFARTYQTRPELFTSDREGEARSYLYASARHVYANYIRDLIRHPTDELTDQTISANNPQNTPQITIDISLLWECIKHLSDTEQLVLRLQYQRGISMSQIAKKLHKSTNAVKLISSRARSKLKKLSKQRTEIKQK